MQGRNARAFYEAPWAKSRKIHGLTALRTRPKLPRHAPIPQGRPTVLLAGSVPVLSPPARSSADLPDPTDANLIDTTTIWALERHGADRPERVLDSRPDRRAHRPERRVRLRLQYRQLGQAGLPADRPARARCRVGHEPRPAAHADPVRLDPDGGDRRPVRRSTTPSTWRRATPSTPARVSSAAPSRCRCTARSRSCPSIPTRAQSLSATSSTTTADTRVSSRAFQGTRRDRHQAPPPGSRRNPGGAGAPAGSVGHCHARPDPRPRPAAARDPGARGDAQGRAERRHGGSGEAEARRHAGRRAARLAQGLGGRSEGARRRAARRGRGARAGAAHRPQPPARRRPRW